MNISKCGRGEDASCIVLVSITWRCMFRPVCINGDDEPSTRIFVVQYHDRHPGLSSI